MSDKTAWFMREALVHEAALRAYLRRLTLNGPEVDDLLQETYARVLALSDEARDRIRNARAFLFRTARNVAFDRLRHQQVIPLQTLLEMDVSSVVDEGPAAEEIIESQQELERLTRVIASLPDRCRQVLTLRKIYGLSLRQIATQLGIAEHTVEKHVSTGLRLCAERLYEQMDNELRPAASKTVLQVIRGGKT
jgi:RNA polymerase sigma-70 factor (ECF subfamily)